MTNLRLVLEYRRLAIIAVAVFLRIFVVIVWVPRGLGVPDKVHEEPSDVYRVIFAPARS